MKEFLVKNKYAVAFVLVLALATGAYFYKPCVEPSPIEVQMLGFGCAIEIIATPVEMLRAEACSYLKREVGCQFEDVDEQQILKFVDFKKQSCVSTKLKAQNKCTANVGQYLKR